MKVLFILFLTIVTTTIVSAQCNNQPCPTPQQPAQVVFQPEITPLQIPEGGMYTTAYLDNVPNIGGSILAYVFTQNAQGGVAKKYISVQITTPPSSWKQEFGGNTPAGYAAQHDPETGVTTYRYIVPKPIAVFVKMVGGTARFFLSY